MCTRICTREGFNSKIVPIMLEDVGRVEDLGRKRIMVGEGYGEVESGGGDYGLYAILLCSEEKQGKHCVEEASSSGLLSQSVNGVVIATSLLQGKGGETQDQEVTCRCEKPAESEKDFDLRDVSRNGRVRRRWGLGRRMLWIEFTFS